MILVDTNQVMISNLMMQISTSKNNDIEEDLVRHMTLNSIRTYRSKFNERFGEIVLCYDNRKVWRREVFPNYKFNRKKDREKSEHDWNLIFETFTNIRSELKEVFPYKVIEVEGAEADDIIATVVSDVNKRGGLEQVLILSSDKDFIQLQKHSFVKQYSPMTKKFVNGVNPLTYIKEHIIKGDRSDGIPNFLSPDNCFVDGLRQKPITKKKLSTWVELEPDEFCSNETILRNYQRNRTLIDFDYIPEEIQTKIMKEFNKKPEGDRSKILNYFISKKLKNLIQDIGDF